jgi:hypothetical protein
MGRRASDFSGGIDLRTLQNEIFSSPDSTDDVHSDIAQMNEMLSTRPGFRMQASIGNYYQGNEVQTFGIVFFDDILDHQEAEYINMRQVR